MARHAGSHAEPLARMRQLPPVPRSLAVVATTLGALGLVIGATAFARPATSIASNMSTQQRSMVFSYTARVPRSAAYDSTTVTSPDPLFRKLTQDVTVRYTYQGQPGRLRVRVDLAAGSGWHTTLPSQAPVREGKRFTGSVQLDLRAIEARAQAAARATGVPISQLTLTVRPTVLLAGGARFAPELPLTLTPLMLTLSSDATKMRVTDNSRVTHHRAIPSSIHIGRFTVAVAKLRNDAAGLLLAAAVAAFLAFVLGCRHPDTSEGDRLRRRHGQLMATAEPMATKELGMIVDVTGVDALIRVAERYGAMVLSSVDEHADHFVVRDDGTTYRYRISHGGTRNQAETNTQPVGTAKP